MVEKTPQGTPASKSESIDPIAFSDEMIYGLDPAIHWVHFNNQREQFPEIVDEIVKHWDDHDWLMKLINRLGYTMDIYDSNENPRGVLSSRPVFEKSYLTAMRYIALRAAGIQTILIGDMFRIGTWNHAGKYLVKGIIKEISQTRKQLQKKRDK